MIEMLIRQLLHNAIKFSYPNSTIKIGISPSKVDDKGIVIRIEDTGCGISEERLDNIFSIDNNSTDVTRGTNGEFGAGLGLQVVNKIITIHKSKIWLHSSVGQGTTVTILLYKGEM